MSDAGVRVFFYGSFMSRDVLARAGYSPPAMEVARLRGFDVRLEGMASVVRDERGVVYGIVCAATHEELGRLYADLGAYRPEAVLVEDLDGRAFPALCYVAVGAPTTPPSPGYLERIVAAAREHGFPEWYVERLERLGGAGT